MCWSHSFSLNLTIASNFTQTFVTNWMSSVIWLERKWEPDIFPTAIRCNLHSVLLERDKGLLVSCYRYPIVKFQLTTTSVHEHRLQLYLHGARFSVSMKTSASRHVRVLGGTDGVSLRPVFSRWFCAREDRTTAQRQNNHTHNARSVTYTEI